MWHLNKRPIRFQYDAKQVPVENFGFKTYTSDPLRFWTMIILRNLWTSSQKTCSKWWSNNLWAEASNAWNQIHKSSHPNPPSPHSPTATHTPTPPTPPHPNSHTHSPRTPNSEGVLKGDRRYPFFTKKIVVVQRYVCVAVFSCRGQLVFCVHQWRAVFVQHLLPCPRDECS